MPGKWHGLLDLYDSFPEASKFHDLSCITYLKFFFSIQDQFTVKQYMFGSFLPTLVAELGLQKTCNHNL
jgi:hypothetical protein